MHISRWISAILFSAPLFAGERITVSVCTQGRLTEKTVIASEAGAAARFRLADIEIAWAKCEIGLEGDEAAQQHWFTVRLREGRPFITPVTSALDTLGEAFLSLDNAGYIADVYYEVVQTVAAAQEVELTTLLGYVIAHELGHLLLGPGHSTRGVMRAGWDFRDLEAIRQGVLKFSPAEGDRMRRILR
jgi:hypothetical protein